MNFKNRAQRTTEHLKRLIDEGFVKEAALALQIFAEDYFEEEVAEVIDSLKKYHPNVDITSVETPFKRIAIGSSSIVVVDPLREKVA